MHSHKMSQNTKTRTGLAAGISRAYKILYTLFITRAYCISSATSWLMLASRRKRSWRAAGLCQKVVFVPPMRPQNIHPRPWQCITKFNKIPGRTKVSRTKSETQQSARNCRRIGRNHAEIKEAQYFNTCYSTSKTHHIQKLKKCG